MILKQSAPVRILLKIKDKTLHFSYTVLKSCFVVVFPHPCFLRKIRKPKDQKEEKSMNKYELALVVSAKLEDEERAAVVEKAKGYITRYNGVITEVEEWGKK